MSRFFFRYVGLFLLFSVLASLSMSWLALARGGLMVDDSWFYAQISYQWVRTGFPTFDGIHTTSGFHLAWGACLALVSWPVSWLTDSKLVHASVLCGAYLSVVWLICERVAAVSMWPRRAHFVCFVFLLLGALLMESAALALVLVLLLERMVATAQDETRQMRWGVALVALGVLSRIDAVVLLVPWLLLEPRAQWRKVLTLGLLLGIGLQLGGMYLIFGEVFSVSSKIKAAASWGAAGELFPGGNKTGLLVKGVLWLALWGWALVSSIALASPARRSLLGAWRERSLSQQCKLFFLRHVAGISCRGTRWLVGLSRSEAQGTSAGDRTLSGPIRGRWSLPRCWSPTRATSPFPAKQRRRVLGSFPPR